MGSDGSTFVDRVEGIEISNNNNNKIIEKKGKLRQGHDVKPRLYLKWSLGELLFNRQAWSILKKRMYDSNNYKSRSVSYIVVKTDSEGNLKENTHVNYNWL